MIFKLNRAHTKSGGGNFIMAFVNVNQGPLNLYSPFDNRFRQTAKSVEDK